MLLYIFIYIYIYIYSQLLLSPKPTTNALVTTDHIDDYEKKIVIPSIFKASHATKQEQWISLFILVISL